MFERNDTKVTIRHTELFLVGIEEFLNNWSRFRSQVFYILFIVKILPLLTAYQVSTTVATFLVCCWCQKVRLAPPAILVTMFLRTCLVYYQSQPKLPSRSHSTHRHQWRTQDENKGAKKSTLKSNKTVKKWCCIEFKLHINPIHDKSSKKETIGTKEVDIPLCS